LHATEVELEQLEMAREEWTGAFLKSTFVDDVGEMEGKTLTQHDLIHANWIIRELSLLLVCVAG